MLLMTDDVDRVEARAREVAKRTGTKRVASTSSSSTGTGTRTASAAAANAAAVSSTSAAWGRAERAGFAAVRGAPPFFVECLGGDT